MPVTTALSGNEIFCLAKKGYSPGNIVIGNSFHALGLAGGFVSGYHAMLGGEIKHVTTLIEEGRATAFARMMNEAITHKAAGIAGVTSELIFHAGKIEFLSIGSIVHKKDAEDIFSTAGDGQELYAQLDTGFKPICFAFGNVAYSMGVGRGLMGRIKTLRQGEIKEYSEILNHTRHLALERIIAHAKSHHANAVLGIETTILPFGGLNEMIMIGTAALHPQLASDQIVTSDMTNIEMWNMASLGYAPMKLLMGTSVYSLGFIGSVKSLLKTFSYGEISELTALIYQARENALAIINQEAKAIGADDVVGVNIHVYQLGNGLVEFLAIGTAVKKLPSIKVETPELPSQAVIIDRNTFYASNIDRLRISTNSGAKPINNYSFFGLFFAIAFIIILVLLNLYFAK